MSSFLVGFRYISILLPRPAAMEEDTEDEEDPGKDRDSPGQGGDHQGRPHGQQDQGRIEELSRPDHYYGEGVELLHEEIRDQEGPRHQSNPRRGRGEAARRKNIYQVSARRLQLDQLSRFKHQS